MTDLCAAFAAQQNISKAKSDVFVKAFFELIKEGLEKDDTIKISGFGVFKIIEISSRESVDVNTGKRFEIKGHKKISFTPDNSLKEIINKPFAMFDIVELEDEEGNEEQNKVNKAAIATVTQEKETDAEDVTGSDTIEATEPAKEETVPAPAVVKEAITPEKKEEIKVNDNTKNEKTKKNDNTEVAIPQKVQKSGRMIAGFGGLFVAVAIFALFFMKQKSEPNPVEQPNEIVKIETPTVQVSDSIVKTEKDSIQELPQTIEQPVPPVTNAPQTKGTPVCIVTLSEKEMNKRLADFSLNDTLSFVTTGVLVEHTVTADETLTRISNKYYGTKKMWPYIVKYNKMGNPNGLCKGMVLKIPVLQSKN